MDKAELRRYKDLGMADLLWVSQLVALRKRKGLTQQQIADRMGVDQSAISKLENVNNGRRKISAEQLNRYARAVGAYTGHIVLDAEEDYSLLKKEIERHTHNLIWNEEAPATGSAAYRISDTLPHTENCRSTRRIAGDWADTPAEDDDAPQFTVTSRRSPLEEKSSGFAEL